VEELVVQVMPEHLGDLVVVELQVDHIQVGQEQQVKEMLAVEETAVEPVVAVALAAAAANPELVLEVHHQLPDLL
jgi:NRPS condensation-like uncharacterized protein